MKRSRAVDWAIGALAMLVLIVLAAVVAWFVISDPIPGPGTSSTPTPVFEDSTPAEVPADLGAEEIWLGEIDLDANVVVLADTTLTDVTARGSGIRSRPNGIVVERLEVEATVPFSDVAAQLGGNSRVKRAADGQAEITRSVEVLGRQLSVVAIGTVTVEDGFLVVEPTSIDLGGPNFLSEATAALVRQFVTIKQPLEGLPPNLILQDVSVQEDGFRAELAGRDVVLADG